GLSNSNFDREKNQQKLIAALQKKATSASTIANPAAVGKMLDALGDNLRTNFKQGELRTLIDVASNTEKMTSLPLVERGDDLPDLVTNGSVGGISIVQPTAGIGVYTEIHAYIAKSLLGSKVVTVDVLNGSDIDGFARSKANEL